MKELSHLVARKGRITGASAIRRCRAQEMEECWGLWGRRGRGGGGRGGSPFGTQLLSIAALMYSSCPYIVVRHATNLRVAHSHKMTGAHRSCALPVVSHRPQLSFLLEIQLLFAAAGALQVSALGRGKRPLARAVAGTRYSPQGRGHEEGQQRQLRGQWQVARQSAAPLGGRPPPRGSAGGAGCPARRRRAAAASPHHERQLGPGAIRPRAADVQAPLTGVKGGGRPGGASTRRHRQG